MNDPIICRCEEIRRSEIQAAIDAGYGIELDIQLSSDKVPMVFHDAELSRICGVEGKIWDYTCAELQQMQLFDSGETIPTLEEALTLIGGQVPILLEYKMDKVDTDVCAYSHELLKDYEGPYAVQSFHPFALFWYRQNAKDIPRGILAKNFIRDNKEKSEKSNMLIMRLLLALSIIIAAAIAILNAWLEYRARS